MRDLIRWTLLVLFCSVGFYLLMWAYQSASFSVPAEATISEIYKTRALLLFPLSLLYVVVGILVFTCIGKTKASDK